MTFSIVAWDIETGMTGVAVATKHLAVGALVPYVEAGVGAIATQAETNPLLGIHGLEMLKGHGHSHVASPEETLQRLLFDDPGREQRQLHMVDRYGQTAAWTGKDCVGWAGHLTFANFSVAGNMLVNEATVQAMADAYARFETRDFCDRLLLALEAGDAAGGDKRGRQSAALRVMHTDSYPYLDLRVDHHAQPIEQLRETFDESRKDYYQSFRLAMPSNRHQALSLPRSEQRAV
ncbi:conserved hypothetical protein [Synechococcus sp. PCC 7335]|uniref:DUF1028 domain-containing protein n=1 Tax=Synechococcus sp. (strain ATCC 29403 / PCC 7335) TaxID=91464 RepID=UPI00017ECACB|nr:DUF1028 domain-containing protein [Synechococcus sp. PCC 7335]EDX86956.1 conserved hypothetical protein [Synechococcus sp. PCC 7335]